MIDDTTFTAARANRAARVLLQALREPRSEQGRVATLAGCCPAEATVPGARLLADLIAYNRLESS
ncbi:hypothetical protein ACWDE0_16100 [Streptomyces sp. 900105755]